jgi:ABC-2 type transport system permease protein
MANDFPMRDSEAGNITRATASKEIRRHALLLFDYFTQYAKVRIGYRGDFFISLAASFAATVFGLFFVVVLFQKVPLLAGWRFEEVLFLYGFSLVPYGMFNVLSANLYEF